MSKNVYVERNEKSYADMWRRWGWNVVDNPLKGDVIQFTGGEDVDPRLYGERMHPQTYISDDRDKRCMELFELGLHNGVKMCGICRGGQFLNVANGGKMFQHCDGHAIYGTHKATVLETGLEVDVTSTHHQIMRPNRETGIVLMEAKRLGTFKEHMFFDDPPHGRQEWVIMDEPEADDIEAVFYPDSMSLSYQPHPEWCDEESTCVQTYKYFLRNHLGLAV